MKLYKVTVELETAVYSWSSEEAKELAKEGLRETLDMPSDMRVTQVESTAGLPCGWATSDLPYGDFPGRVDFTVADYFERKEAP